MNDKKNVLPHFLGDVSKDHSNKADTKRTKVISPSKTKAAKQGKKSDALSLIRPQQIAPLLQLRDVAFTVGVDVQRTNPRLTFLSAAQSPNHSEVVSSFSQKSNPPSSATMIATMSGYSFSESIDESLKKTNDLLNQEVQKLRGQVDSLRKRCEIQEYELQKSESKVMEAMSFAAEESAKCRSAKEAMKSLTQQLKEMAQRLPQNVYETDPVQLRQVPNGNGPSSLHHGNDSNDLHHPDFDRAQKLTNNATDMSQIDSTVQNPTPRGVIDATLMSKDGRTNTTTELNGLGLEMNSEHISNGEAHIDNHVEAEWVEQYEAGVYITLIALTNGSIDLKRVRFSRKRFPEQHAETWWSEHRKKVYEKYNIRGLYRSSSTLSTQSTG